MGNKNYLTLFHIKGSWFKIYKRLKAYLEEIQSINEDNDLYIHNGKIYAVNGLIKAILDFSQDKKGGEFWKKYTFKINYKKFISFLNLFKTTIKDVEVKDNKLYITTEIDSSFITDWSTLDNKLIKSISKSLKEIKEEVNKEIDIKIDDNVNFLSSEELYLNKEKNKIYYSLDDNLNEANDLFRIKIIPKKYLGKINKTTELNLIISRFKEYNTKFLIEFKAKNKNLITSYMGLLLNFIPTGKEVINNESWYIYWWRRFVWWRRKRKLKFYLI